MVLSTVYVGGAVLPKRRPRSAAHEHLGREAVPVGGDGADVIAKREAVGGNGRDAVAGAVNVGKGAAADLGDPVGVAAVVRPTAGPSSGCLWVAVLLGCATSRPKNQRRHCKESIRASVLGAIRKARAGAAAGVGGRGQGGQPIRAGDCRAAECLRGHRPVPGIGWRRRAPQRRLYGPGTPGRTAWSADNGVAATAAAVRGVGDGCYPHSGDGGGGGRNRSAAWRGTPRCTNRCRLRSRRWCACRTVSSTRWRGRVLCGRPPSNCTADSGSGTVEYYGPRRRGLGCGGGGALGARATSAAGRGRAGIFSPDTAIAG